MFPVESGHLIIWGIHRERDTRERAMDLIVDGDDRKMQREISIIFQYLPECNAVVGHEFKNSCLQWDSRTSQTKKHGSRRDQCGSNIIAIEQA